MQTIPTNYLWEKKIDCAVLMNVALMVMCRSIRRCELIQVWSVCSFSVSYFYFCSQLQCSLLVDSMYPRLTKRKRKDYLQSTQVYNKVQDGLVCHARKVDWITAGSKSCPWNRNRFLFHRRRHRFALDANTMESAPLWKDTRDFVHGKIASVKNVFW